VGFSRHRFFKFQVFTFHRRHCGLLWGFYFDHFGLLLADHHQHLVSRAGLALLYPQPLDGTALPDELARVVSQIESRWNDPAALAKLMTDAALVRTDGGAGWARGRAAASEALGTLFARPYRITRSRLVAKDTPRTWKAFSRAARARRESTSTHFNSS